MTKIDELIENLEADAEWASANEWESPIGEDHYRTSNLENLANTIIGIITEHAIGRINNSFIIDADTEEVSW